MSATVIAAHTRVHGSIFAEGDLVIEGFVEGAVRAQGVIRLLASAEVRGDLEASRVIIDDGALFEGQVRLRRGNAAKVATPVARAPVSMAPLPTPPPSDPEPTREVPPLATPGRRRLQRRIG